MASPYSVLALDAAGWLELELASAATHLRVSSPVLDCTVRGQLVQAIAAARSTARRLRELVAAAAVVEGEAAIEIYGQALRARAAVVLRALRALVDVEAEIPPPAFAGRFRSVRQVAEHVAKRLVAIDERWLRERAGFDGVDLATRNALAYATLDDAEVALESIGRDPLLWQFLRLGRASQSSAVRAACLEIAVGIGLRSNIAPRAREAERTGPDHEVAP